VLESDSKFIASDGDVNDEIVHWGRFGEANGATYETLDTCPQIDMFAFDHLCMLLPNVTLLWGRMPLVSPHPPAWHNTLMKVRNRWPALAVLVDFWWASVE